VERNSTLTKKSYQTGKRTEWPVTGRTKGVPAFLGGEEKAKGVSVRKGGAGGESGEWKPTWRNSRRKQKEKERKRGKICEDNDSEKGCQGGRGNEKKKKEEKGI